MYLTSYLKQNKLNSIFFVFKPWILFSMTRGGIGAITNPCAISYCPSTFYTLFYLKLWKNLTSCVFFGGKTCKKYLEFPANEKFARIILLWLPFMGLSRLGAGDLTRSHFLWCACTPLHAETSSQYSMSFRCLTGIWHYHAILCPFCGVHGSISGWSVSVMGWAVRLHAALYAVIFTRSRCAGCAAIKSVNRTLLWLGPFKIGLIYAWSGCCMCSPIHPWRWFRALQPWVPDLSCACAMFEWYSHHLTMRRKENSWLGERNTWGTRTSIGKHLRDENFLGDCGHFLWLIPH